MSSSLPHLPGLGCLGRLRCRGAPGAAALRASAPPRCPPAPPLLPTRPGAAAFSSPTGWSAAGRRLLPAPGRVGRGGAPCALASAAGGGAGGGGEGPNAIYIHIPFCRRRCFYCDFPIQVVGDKATGSVEEGMEQYVAMLEKELAATPILSHGPMSTVFFGGGTPSLLPPRLLDRVIRAVDRTLGVAGGAEISMEIDPGTFDEERLRGYVGAGVTRVSLGVQSFQQELLTVCGRAHTMDDTRRALDIVHRVRPEVWSLDLMGGLPGQTRAQWQSSLDATVAAEPDHVSVYDLQVEEGTLFGKKYTPGEAPLPPEGEAAEYYRMASASLGGAGLEHYEVSNYARPGAQCRHNLVYWRNQPYYALGVGAASYLGERRFSRPRRMKDYAAWVDRLAQRGGGGRVGSAGAAYSEAQQDDSHEQLLDAIMLGLRLAEGLDLAHLRARHGAPAVSSLLEGLLEAEAAGLARGLGPGGGQLPLGAGEGVARVRLTSPEGFLLSNDVISTAFANLDRDED